MPVPTLRRAGAAALAAAALAGAAVAATPATPAAGRPAAPAVAAVLGADGASTLVPTGTRSAADPMTRSVTTAAANGTYTFLWLVGGKPVRWNPCAPIRFEINRNGAVPASEITHIRAAFAQTGRSLGGVRFVYAGTTALVPDKIDDTRKVGTDIVLAFARPGSGATRSSMLGGGAEAARGGFTSGGTTDGDGLHVPVASAGAVVVNSAKIATMSRRVRTVLYLHEIGHAVGLGHTNDRRQVMYPSLLGSGPRAYAAGDRTGLRSLGRTQGCLQAPARPAAPTFRADGGDVLVSVPKVSSPSGTVKYRLNVPGAPSVNGRTSATPTFRVRLSLLDTLFGDRKYAFSISATNRVGQSTGRAATYTVPR